jgi:hypothetical protein
VIANPASALSATNTVIAWPRTQATTSGVAQRRSTGIRRQTRTTSPSQSFRHWADEPRGRRQRTSSTAAPTASTETTASPPTCNEVQAPQGKGFAPPMTAAHSKASVSPISAIITPAARTVCCARSGSVSAAWVSRRSTISSASTGTANWARYTAVWYGSSFHGLIAQAALFSISDTVSASNTPPVPRLVQTATDEARRFWSTRCTAATVHTAYCEAGSIALRSSGCLRAVSSTWLPRRHRKRIQRAPARDSNVGAGSGAR